MLTLDLILLKLNGLLNILFLVVQKKKKNFQFSTGDEGMQEDSSFS